MSWLLSCKLSVQALSTEAIQSADLKAAEVGGPAVECLSLRTENDLSERASLEICDLKRARLRLELPENNGIKYACTHRLLKKTHFGSSVVRLGLTLEL